MLIGAVRKYIDGHRSRFLTTRIDKLQSQSQSQSFLPIPHPFTIYAHFGQRMGQEASYNIRSMLRNPREHFFRKRRGTVEFVCLWALAWGGVSLLQPVVGEGTGSKLAVGVLLLWGVLITYAYVRARLDFRKVKRLSQISQDPTPEGVRTAFQKCGSSQTEISRFATAVLATACNGSPGKFVKTLEISPEGIVETMVKELQSNDLQTVQNIAVCLRWLSRDYPEACAPYAKAVAETVKACEDSAVRQNLLLTLGQIGGQDTTRGGAYAKAILPGVADPDAEVRSAAAAALQQVPKTDPAEQLLSRLAEDPSPTVQQTLN